MRRSGDAITPLKADRQRRTRPRIARGLFPPILFRFPLHRRSLRILKLEPSKSRASARWSEIHPDRLTSNRIEAQSALIEPNGGIMKKAKKRAESKSSSKRRVKSKKSSKRVAAKSKTRKQTTKSKKSSLPNTSKLKRVAKEAAVSAGVAALGTALSAMEPQRKGAEKDDTSKN
jgi:hypothetical protein